MVRVFDLGFYELGLKRSRRFRRLCVVLLRGHRALCRGRGFRACCFVLRSCDAATEVWMGRYRQDWERSQPTDLDGSLLWWCNRVPYTAEVAQREV